MPLCAWRLIPMSFDLSLSSALLRQIADEHGTPVWVYDAAMIRRRIDDLRAFDTVRFAQKANSNTHVLRLMRESAGNVSRAARLAGKERRALGKLLKKYCIEPGYFRTPSNA